MMDVYSVPKFSESEKKENEIDADANNNNNNNNNSDSNSSNDRLKLEKYSLRPRSLRQKTEKGLELKKEIVGQRTKKNEEGSKPKQKPPPLSKYRRKTANARERNRMREINVAFETLRRAVPHISGSLHSGNEKLTKITTLRLAMKYIQALRQVLNSTGNHQTVPHHLTLSSFIEDDADLDVLLSDGESLHFGSDLGESLASRDHSLTSPFSELSNSENSPDFCGSQDLPFHDSINASDFRFEDNLPDSEFCEDFLNAHCIDGLS